MSTYSKKKRISLQSEVVASDSLWKRCPSCRNVVAAADVDENLGVCPQCSHHARIDPRQRISLMADEGTFVEFDPDLEASSTIDFPGYAEKLEAARAASDEPDAVVTGRAQIGGHQSVLAVMDHRFMMGSMGAVVGEKLTRAVEYATAERLPVVVFTASGGARMQEGLVSLVQMAKVSAALALHDQAGLLYVSVLTDPTTGGVTASFASLGDIILAEPGALIGFAGRRVIEATIKKHLPPEFQTAEFMLEHGFVDRIVERGRMKTTITSILRLHEGSVQSDAVVPRAATAPAPAPTHGDGDEEPQLPGRGAWRSVKIARDKRRPTARQYIEAMTDDFLELHGDRLFGDDLAIVGGIGWVGGRAVTLIGQDKGFSTTEKVACNFGCPHPEGYRKSLRLMHQAEKFGRPVVCLVDTQGAYCGVGAEERGQGEAIARNLVEMSTLRTPIVTVFVGEGGSGGALALAVADRIGILENAVFSVLSPEGFASILWKDGTRAFEAAELMGMTSRDVIALGVADDLIPEPSGGAHRDTVAAMFSVGSYVFSALEQLEGVDVKTLLARRRERFRRIGASG